MNSVDTQNINQQYEKLPASFVNLLLRLAAILGFVLIGINYSWLTALGFITITILYAALLIIAFVAVPPMIKGGTLLAVIYFAGLYTVLQSGPWSAGLIYFISDILIAALLFEERIDRWVFSFGLLAIAIIASLQLSGAITFVSTKIVEASPSNWLTYGAIYVVVSIILMQAIDIALSRLKSITANYQDTIALLSAEKDQLKKDGNEWNTNLIKKTEQLRAASFIARETAEIHDLGEILNAVVNLVTDQFGFYHAGIFLINESGDEAVLQAASSDGGKQMLEKGHALKVGAQGVVGYAAAQKKPRIALDVGSDAVYFDNPDLPNTRSEAALPLVTRNKVLGVLDIQSEHAMAFHMDDIDVLEMLANQVAVAIDKTRLLDETQTALMQIEMLTNVRTRETWGRMAKSGSYAFTYTPLGLSAGKSSQAPESALKIPITLRGQRIGLISISRKDKATWGDTEKELINEIAYQTGLAMDNLRLVKEATERAKQEQTVGELASRFSQTMDIDSLLQTAAREIGHVPDVSEVSVFIGEIPEQSPQKRNSRRATGQE